MTPALHRRQRNWGARVREVAWLGLPAVVLENELLRVGVLAGRGADIFELLYKPRDVDLVWLAAGGFRPHAGGFVDGYGGGWQEILPNGGAPSTYAGATFGQHDEVSLLPWDYEIVEDTEERVTASLSVACAKVPLRLVKRLRLASGSPRLELDETLVNEGGVSVRLMWGHHIALGAPFVGPGARIVLPDGVEGLPHPAALNGTRRVTAERFRWPHAVSPDGDELDLSVLPPPGTPSEIVYLTGFPARAWYEVGGDELALRVEWDAGVMPYLWFWQEFGGTVGYPWYGRHWNIGLEPFSSYPTSGLAEAVANGTALELGPGAERAFSLSAEVVARA